MGHWSSVSQPRRLHRSRATQKEVRKGSSLVPGTTSEPYVNTVKSGAPLTRLRRRLRAFDIAKPKPTFSHSS